MGILFIQYPKCSTCQKAGKWLTENQVEVKSRHIVEERPTVEELREWHARSGLPLKKFFNTSGQIYKSEGLKDRLPSMSEEEKLELLAQNGMLVKRPILVGDDFILVGFNEEEWRSTLLRG